MVANLIVNFLCCQEQSIRTPIVVHVPSFPSRLFFLHFLVHVYIYNQRSEHDPEVYKSQMSSSDFQLKNKEDVTKQRNLFII